MQGSSRPVRFEMRRPILLLLISGELNPPRWHADAGCREHPELDWFTDDPDSAAAAADVCSRCPARVDCLEWSLAQAADLQGVWGGLDQAGRERERQARGIVAPREELVDVGRTGRWAAGVAPTCIDCGARCSKTRCRGCYEARFAAQQAS